MTTSGLLGRLSAYIERNKIKENTHEKTTNNISYLA